MFFKYCYLDFRLACLKLIIEICDTAQSVHPIRPKRQRKTKFGGGTVREVLAAGLERSRGAEGLQGFGAQQDRGAASRT